MDARFCKEGQLLYVEKDVNHNVCNTNNIELVAIAVSKWDERNVCSLVLEAGLFIG